MIVESLCQEEGFIGFPYKDIHGIWTQGHGLKLPLTSDEYQIIHGFRQDNNLCRGLIMYEDESALIVKYRLELYKAELYRAKPVVEMLSDVRKFVLEHMIYQLGVPTVLKFKNMWKAIEDKDFDKAGFEMLDSAWYRQMHKADMTDGHDEENRAEWLADLMATDVMRDRAI